MTNKQERYYVVSESELCELIEAATGLPQTSAYFTERAKAEDACHTRPVPKWATHFAGAPYPGYDTKFKMAKEIKK